MTQEEWEIDAAMAEGDARRCTRHPEHVTSSPDGLLDAPCPACEWGMEEADAAAEFLTAAERAQRFFEAMPAEVQAKVIEDDHAEAIQDDWPEGEARLFERTEVQDEEGRRDAWAMLQRCLCGASKPAAWTAGVHHGARRCARVVTRLEVVLASPKGTPIVVD